MSSDINLPHIESDIPVFRSYDSCYVRIARGEMGFPNAEWDDYTDNWAYTVFSDCVECTEDLSACAEPVESGSVPIYSVYRGLLAYRGRPTRITISSTSYGLCVVSPTPPVAVELGLTATNGFIVIPSVNLIDCVTYTVTIGGKSIYLDGTYTPSGIIGLCVTAGINYVVSGSMLECYDLATLGFNYSGLAQLTAHVTLVTFDTTPVSDTALLLHCEGPDGSTTFIDSGMGSHTMSSGTGANPAEIDTSDFRFGSSSIKFTRGVSNSGGSYVITPSSSSSFSPGSGDYCLDLWFKVDTSASSTRLLTLSDNAGNYEIVIGVNGSVVRWSVSLGSSVFYRLCSTTLAAGWHHVAMVRKGTAHYLFLDGSLEDSTIATYTAGSEFAYVILGRPFTGNIDPAYHYDGWMDEVRVSIGSARIDDATDPLYIPSGIPEDGFMPPSSPYSNGSITPGITLSTPCSFEPENIFQRWDAVYSCTSASWVLTPSSATAPVHGWFDSDTGKYCVVRGYLLPDTDDLTVPSCYFYWQATYSCLTSSWDVSLTYVDTTGTVQDWTDWGGYYVKVTTTSEVPAPPDVTPSCYYYWSSSYDCGTLTWSTPNLDFIDTMGFEQPWMVWDYFANCVTTTSSIPDVPTEVPVC